MKLLSKPETSLLTLNSHLTYFDVSFKKAVRNIRQTDAFHGKMPTFFYHQNKSFVLVHSLGIYHDTPNYLGPLSPSSCVNTIQMGFAYEGLAGYCYVCFYWHCRVKSAY